MTYSVGWVVSHGMVHGTTRVTWCSIFRPVSRPTGCLIGCPMTWVIVFHGMTHGCAMGWATCPVERLLV